MQAEGVTFRTGVFVGDTATGSGVTNWAKERISPDSSTNSSMRSC
jgi:hypothetical protein